MSLQLFHMFCTVYDKNTAHQNVLHPVTLSCALDNTDSTKKKKNLCACLNVVNTYKNYLFHSYLSLYATFYFRWKFCTLGSVYLCVCVSSVHEFILYGISGANEARRRKFHFDFARAFHAVICGGYVADTMILQSTVWY